MGDTGVVIYANSVLGARSNFEGGPSALAAALTGRTPRYGYHLDEARRATRASRLTASPRDLSEWGALGGIVGEACGSYWQVPVIEGLDDGPWLGCAEAFRRGAGELRLGGAVPHARHHRGGSGVRRRSARARPDRPVRDRRRFSLAMRHRATSSMSSSSPRRSCRCSRSPRSRTRVDGRRIHPDTTVLVATSPEIKHAADRMGLTGSHRGRGRRRRRRGSASTRAMPARWPRPMAGPA